MVLNRAIKMRIYPDDEQRHKIDATLSHCRYIYNKMLERNTVIYKRRKEHLNYYAMQNLLPEMKDYLPWLKEADSKALQKLA
jgi:putative transposase